MTPGSIDPSQRSAARVAGLVYLITFMVVIAAHYGFYMRLVIPGNIVETIDNIAENESSFRTAIVLYLVYAIGSVGTLIALYEVLKPVSRGLALFAAASRFVWALTWILGSLNLFAALRLIKGSDYLRAFEAERFQSLVRFQMNAGFEHYYVGLLFYSIGSAIFAYVLLKSRYVGVGLAAFGVIPYLWCAACTLALLINPGFAKVVNLLWFETPFALFELVLSFWLIKGLGSSQVAPASSNGQLQPAI